jgi:bla regulator protein BlaR1
MKLKIVLLMLALAAPAVYLAAEGMDIKISTAAGNGRLADDINLPFVDDPAIIGEWESVDIVRETADFRPGERRFKDPLYLKGITFRAKGWMTGLSETWTKGFVLDEADHTASAYIIKDIGGARYMFLEWKSGDYTIRHMKPCYYVLKKK